MSYKLRIRMPDGRDKLCGCGTNDRARYDEMRQWVQALKRADRLDVLEMIVSKGVSLKEAFRLRATPDAVLALSGVRNIEPYVARWHVEKEAARKGAASADKYLRQVRTLIPAGRTFLASRLTALELRRWLRGLDVEDPTRNRYKAALASFCEYLVEEGVLPQNPIRDVRGFSEGTGRWHYYEVAEAAALLSRIASPEAAGAVALAIGACFEWQAIQRVRVRDIDLMRHLAFANGGKTAWRRRQCRLLVRDASGQAPLFDFCEPYIAACLRNKLPDAPVFAGLRTDKDVLYPLQTAARAAGLPVLTLHDQRHTHTVAALRAGYSVMVAAQQLGHSNAHLVWTRYGRFMVDQRDYEAGLVDRQDAEKVG